MPESDLSNARHVLQVIREQGDLLTWWPGEGDAVVIGAVLTQQTRWENVEIGLARLQERGLCDLLALYRADEGMVQEAIRPTGFYRAKTRCLKALSALIVERFGNLEQMAGQPLPVLRTALREVRGIGPETADSILCYGLKKSTLVIDRYTERICACAGIPHRGERLKMLLESCLEGDPATSRRVHAQFVEHAKQYCGKKRCEQCAIPKPNR